MELSTIEMEAPRAREAFLDYRRAVRAAHDAVDEELMRGYKALADGRTLLRLGDTLRRGGTQERTFRSRNTGSAFTVTLPCLAVVRADADTCFTHGVEENCFVEFRARRGRDLHARNRKDRVRSGPVLAEPPAHPAHAWGGRELRAIAPVVPPRFRPARGLGGYHVLFEAEWALDDPPAPIDPALLKHVGGDLWAVVATWDLTPLERAVLEGRPS